jgi:hypothetical protein
VFKSLVVKGYKARDSLLLRCVITFVACGLINDGCVVPIIMYCQPCMSRVVNLAEIYAQPLPNSRSL